MGIELPALRAVLLSVVPLLPSGDPVPQAPAAAGRGPVEAAAEEALARLLPRLVELRRRIHAHPELGEREHETAALVARFLRELGLEVREGIAGTGVVGELRGGRPGETVAYRADMDALPITERTGLPYASTRTDVWNGEEVGVMHACGHDVHVACALGVAGILADPAVRPGLRGRVLFLFQPAEEGLPGGGLHGAARMLAEGVFEGARPSAVFGLHVNPLLPVGRVGLVPRGALAAVDRFTIRVRGRQAHGAYPQAGVDPIVAASHVVVALQTIVARDVDTRDTVVVTVGAFEAGNRFNVIPREAELVGTIRTHDEDVQALVHERLVDVATGIADAHGATAEVEIETLTPVTYNDPGLVRAMRPVLERALGAESVVAERPHMGGEDFAFFAREVPGLFYFLGTTDVSAGEPALIHTAEFAPDEGAIEVGARASSRLVLGYLCARAKAPR